MLNYEICEVLRTPFFTEHLRWLLLNFIKPFYATDFFLYSMKKSSGDSEKYKWHEKG